MGRPLRRNSSLAISTAAGWYSWEFVNAILNNSSSTSWAMWFLRWSMSRSRDIIVSFQRWSEGSSRFLFRLLLDELQSLLEGALVRLAPSPLSLVLCDEDGTSVSFR